MAIDEGASANIEINKGESEAPKLDLVNNGTVSELTLSTKADVNVSGKNTAAAIPVTSTASAGGSTISTSQNLNLKAESKVELTLNAGAENTTATVSDAANIPDVKGLGKVPVKDSDSGKILDTVVAEKDETVKVNKVSVSGKVVTAEDKAPFAGASVYLLNYAAGINKGNVSQYLTEENKVADTAENGTYAFEAEWGNYWFVVKAEGYRTVLQTVEITSAYENAFSNEQVELVAGEDDATGNIELTLVDAATGDAIDYAVALEIREGANNVSGNILKEIAVEASANGKCAIEELPIGSYTIQVVSADAKSEIVAAPFSVTVTAGQTITKTFSVTRIINDDQIRFVLRWGDEESGAPSDLDSHLVGPRAKGIGNFHTYYSDETYGEYDGEDSYVKYADLDVDDTTWEGPETTTIYKQTAGTYRFYIYDFSDQSDEESKNMSDKSGAIVTVYRGSTLLNTFSVPTGQSGNLWHVCDYDSVTGRVTSVNTVGYWPDDGSSTVGMSEEEVLKASLQRKIDMLTDYANVLVDNEYKTNMLALLSEAEKLNTSEEMKEMISKLDDVLEIINHFGSIEEVMVDGVYANYSSRNEGEYDLETGITISGKSETLGELTVTFWRGDNENFNTQIEDVTGEEYVKRITVTDSISGAARIWKVYYQLDYSDLFRISPEDITGPMVTRAEVSSWSKSGMINIYFLENSNHDFTIKTADNITYTVNTDTEAYDYDAEVIMTCGDKTYSYIVNYITDTRVTTPDRIYGAGILQYTLDMDEKTITVMGTAESLQDMIVESDDENKVAELQKDEQGNIIGVTMTNKRVNVTEVYSVKYLKYEAPVVECDKEYTVSLDRDSVQYFTFVPEKSGYYDLRNTNTTRDSWYSNVDIYVYRDSKYVEHNANGYLEDVYLEGGETYYFELSQYEGDNFSITFKVTYISDYDEDELSLPESDGFANETTAADTEAATFGDESFVEESETAPEADGFTAEGGFEESTEENAEADADALAFEDFQ